MIADWPGAAGLEVCVWGGGVALCIQWTTRSAAQIGARGCHQSKKEEGKREGEGREEIRTVLYGPLRSNCGPVSEEKDRNSEGSWH